MTSILTTHVAVGKNLPRDLIDRLGLFLNQHERSCITDTPCTICANFRHPKTLDKDIDENLIKNFCKEDRKIVDKIDVKKLTSNAQRIHVIGNIWNIINCFNHRKFHFFCKSIKLSTKDSICITDVDTNITKLDNKIIITQGYSNNYDLTSVDFLLVEKKYIDDSFEISFSKNIIPEKGFLVIDLHNNEKFYTE